MSSRWMATAVALLIAVPAARAQDAADGDDGVRLVLQITVDQLRGDMPSRWLDRMGEGGFRKLLDEGVVFADAHHRHANTETIVGHTTLATGSDPSVHGMVGNVWFDRTEDRYVYNVEDHRYPLLSADAGVSQDTEIDPTQRTARSDGRSPNAILVSTFSDELALRTNGRAKIFGVSVKDRGAIAMAGHAGKAFWFSKKGGEFVTSRYYYEQYPEWVTAWNAKKPANAYADTEWKLLHDRETYELGEHDDRKWEADLAGFGRVFPHSYGADDGKYFTTLLTVSPAGDELVAAFAKELIESYRHPYLNLDRDAIAKAGLKPEAVAQQVELLPGVAHAIASADLAAGRVPDTEVHRQVLRNFHHRRSGDIYLVFEAHWMINDFDGLTVASTHGSPWTYDTYVPIVFAGAGLSARRSHRRVHTVDVAPTLAALLGTKPPSGATGRVLVEVLGE